MPNEPRYFLGYGERLTGRVTAPSSGPPPGPAYTLDEAIARLTPRVTQVASSLQSLPDGACPADQAVTVMTMHPQSIAKSYFPSQVLSHFGLRHVGSRPTVITPEQWTRQDEVSPTPSTDLFVAGSRESFRAFAESVAAGVRGLPDGLRRIEDVRVFTYGERVRGLPELSGPFAHAAGGPADTSGGPHAGFALGEPTADLEVVLHASDTADDAYVVEAFAEYAADLGVDARLGKRALGTCGGGHPSRGSVNAPPMRSILRR